MYKGYIHVYFFARKPGGLTRKGMTPPQAWRIAMRALALKGY